MQPAVIIQMRGLFNSSSMIAISFVYITWVTSWELSASHCGTDRTLIATFCSELLPNAMMFETACAFNGKTVT